MIHVNLMGSGEGGNSGGSGVLAHVSVYSERFYFQLSDFS
jgi:hypothetical protein